MLRTVGQAFLDLDGWLEAMFGDCGLQCFPSSIKTLQHFPDKGSLLSVHSWVSALLVTNDFNLKKKSRGQWLPNRLGESRLMEMAVLELGSGKRADFEHVTVAPEERVMSKPRKLHSMCGPAALQAWSLDGDRRESNMAGRNKTQADTQIEDLEGWCDLTKVEKEGERGKVTKSGSSYVTTPPTLPENHFLKNSSWASLSHTLDWVSGLCTDSMSSPTGFFSVLHISTMIELTVHHLALFPTLGLWIPTLHSNTTEGNTHLSAKIPDEDYMVSLMGYIRCGRL